MAQRRSFFLLFFFFLHWLIEFLSFLFQLYKFCGMPEGPIHLPKQQLAEDDIGVESFDFNLVLGVGGFGTVYLAKKKDDGRFF